LREDFFKERKNKRINWPELGYLGRCLGILIVLLLKCQWRAIFTSKPKPGWKAMQN
jgi:hypothetical protein